VGVTVRAARPSEYAEIGALTLHAYTLDGLLDDDGDYARELRDAAHRAEHADLLVAVAEDQTVVGTVTFCLPGSPYAELSREGQAEFRMLAVTPDARGQGIGERLVRACLDRAARCGCTSVVISTRPQMVSAHRIYHRLLFKRTPELDWNPEPGIELIAYTRALEKQ
jgi:ribosomal protein S18 acetylase RimI-like enzyme